ncbi:MAG: hypothetical protein IPO31_16360 [Candidatus Obscuribacter sp.]|nr:hypothetical protein [Candidatus Obscuribacter sp.]
MADLKNSGGAPGSTTAAWFIRRFAGEDIPWVHLDIASVAFRDRELGPDPRVPRDTVCVPGRACSPPGEKAGRSTVGWQRQLGRPLARSD